MSTPETWTKTLDLIENLDGLFEEVDTYVNRKDVLQMDHTASTRRILDIEARLKALETRKFSESDDFAKFANREIDQSLSRGHALIAELCKIRSVQWSSS